MARISAIAAIGKSTRALGKDGRLLWDIPEDMRHFKELTSGHPVIMGRRTWESIPDAFRPLPNRTNIVVTRSSADFEGATMTHTIEEALAAAKEAPRNEEIFIIGGGEIFALTLPFTDRLYLTLVDDDAEGDAFFPEYDDFTKVIEEEAREGTPPYTFITLER